MYYTDWGEKGQVSRCELDGSNPTIIQEGLDNPNGIALHGDSLIVVDSHAKTKENHRLLNTLQPQNGSLYFSDTSGKKWNLTSAVLGVKESIRFIEKMPHLCWDLFK